MTSRREILATLRDELVSAVDAASVKDLPAVCRELRLVLAELDGLPSAKADAPADEIEKRREARRRAATG